MNTLTSARPTAISPMVVHRAIAPPVVRHASPPPTTAERDWPRTVLALITAAVAVAATGAIVMMISTLPAEDFEVISRLMALVT